MAKKRDAVQVMTWGAFAVDLTDLLAKYNGKLWKVKDAATITAGVNFITGMLPLFFRR